MSFLQDFFNFKSSIDFSKKQTTIQNSTNNQIDKSDNRQLNLIFNSPNSSLSTSTKRDLGLSGSPSASPTQSIPFQIVPSLIGGTANTGESATSGLNLSTVLIVGGLVTGAVLIFKK